MALTPEYWIPQDTKLHPSDLKDLPETLQPMIDGLIDDDFIAESDAVELSSGDKLALGFNNPK